MEGNMGAASRGRHGHYHNSVVAICLLLLFSCATVDSPVEDARKRKILESKPIFVEVSISAVWVRLEPVDRGAFQAYRIHTITQGTRTVEVPRVSNTRLGYGSLGGGSDLPTVVLDYMLEGQPGTTSQNSVVITCRGHVDDTPFKIEEEFDLSNPRLSVHLLPYNEVYRDVNWVLLWQMSVSPK
jgi:hypothetical protein